MLERRVFTLYTDHKPLTFAFQQRSDKASPRQLRHLDFVGQFTTDIRHIIGEDNVVADALSRIESINASSQVDFEKMARAQTSDEELKLLLENPKALKFIKSTIPGSNTKHVYGHNSSICSPPVPQKGV